jgi:serine protease Do
VGSSLDIGVLRDAKRENFKVVVGNLAQIFPEEFGGGRQDATGQNEGTSVSFGMTINPLTDRQRETLGIKEKGGVTVSEVEPGSFAEDVGLMRSDLILEINRHAVNSAEDIKKIQATLKPGDPVMFRVMRHDPRRNEWASIFLPGTLPNQMH